MNQQELLNHLRLALAKELNHPLLQDRLRTIRERFYKREFELLFTDQDLCKAYTCEYMPSRALCYMNVISQLSQVLLNVD